MVSTPTRTTAPGGSETIVALDAVGARLRRRRLALGLSLRDVQRRCGLTPSFVSKVERGLARPSMETLFQLARALGSDPRDLVDADGAPLVPHLTVTRAGERAMLPPEPVGVFRRVVGTGTRTVVYEAVLDCGARVTHPPSGGEMVVEVLRGAVELQVGDRVVRLQAGDSAVYSASEPRSLRAVGGERPLVRVVHSRPDGVPPRFAPRAASPTAPRRRPVPADAR